MVIMNGLNNMKNIKELGLELIELEDQVLLVDRKLGIKHIASTKPLEGIPLLVIEDEAESEYYKTHAKAGFGDYDDFPTFKEGYDKAKETYKFTEGNLLVIRNKFVQLLPIGDINAWDLIKSIQKYTEWFDKYIQSLTKKELWVEVELSLIKENHKTGYTVEKLVPKTTNNQIKAIWK